MQCPNCGKEIPNDSIYCEFCGARMKKSRKALWIILSVVLAVVIAVVAFAIIQEQQERQAVIAWEQQQAAQKQRELEQQLEAERQAKLEAERKAELARQEAERQAKLEAERKAELVRQEAARKAEAARQAEIARQKEAERQAKIARQREARRQELLSQGYVDLGLPSGTLWKNANEGGDYTQYTYDEAVRKFGNKLPTKQQFGELRNKCTWTWTGSGSKVIGPNGNSIYLPAAGYRDSGYVGTYGGYWSSTPYDSDGAWRLGFGSDGADMYGNYRWSGYSVRLVQNL